MASSLAKFVTVLITVPSKEVGLNISRTIVQEKLAACVNIVPAVTSIYEWEGKLEQSDELLMIVKTCNERILKLEEHTAPKYAAWLENQTGIKDQAQEVQKDL